MIHRRWIALLAPVAVVAATAVAFADHHETKSSPGSHRPSVAATIGKPETAKWSNTTIEAAVEEANKKILASGKAIAVTGEVVDVSCYLQLGRRGLAHVACGTKCINNGQPIGIVDAQDQLYLLFPEPHHPRRDGTASIKDIFLPYLAQQVTVNGMMTQLKGGIRALYVEADIVNPEAVPDGGPRKQ